MNIVARQALRTRQAFRDPEANVSTWIRFLTDPLKTTQDATLFFAVPEAITTLNRNREWLPVIEDAWLDVEDRLQREADRLDVQRPHFFQKTLHR